MAQVNFVRVARVLEQPAYVAVGFGVLGYQRAQAWRRAWQRRLSHLASSAQQPSPPTPGGRSRHKPPTSAADRVGPFVSGVAGLAAERLRPMVTDAAERVGPFMSEAAERVAPYVSDAAERVGPFMSDAAERVGPFMAEAVDRVGPLVAEIGPAVSEAAEQLKPEAQEFLRAATDLVNDLPEEARELAREAFAFGRLALQAFRAPEDRDRDGRS
jgi:hypothetical protein